MPILKSLMAIMLALSSLSLAAAPQIVASIAPLHSLASAVAGDRAELRVLIDNNRSPHLFSMSAGAARALADADLVLWTGEGLERFLVGPIDALASGATRLQLAQLSGIHTLPQRKNPLDGETDHAHGHAHESAHIDYHLWLAPHNARVAVRAIAAALGDLDPPNAAFYQRNADDYERRLTRVEGEIRAQLQPLRQHRFLTLHDSFQYFEHAFGLRSAGVIAIQPDIRPGAASVRRLNAAIERQQIGCVFSEPQFSRRLVDRLVEAHELRSAELDPIGVALAPGANQYLQLLQSNADAFARCLAAGARE